MYNTAVFKSDRFEMYEEVKTILARTLQLGERANRIRPETPLMGNLPELDSMAVVSILTALEDHYGFVIEDDEISAETFATMGSLVSFVERKVKKQVSS